MTAPLDPLPKREVDSLRAVIGSRVARARRGLGLSQRKLAAIMDRSPSWVREIENGAQFAPPYLLQALAVATQRSVGWFYGELVITLSEYVLTKVETE